MDFYFISCAASIVTFFAFFFSLFSSKSIMGIISTWIAFLAGFLTLMAFAVDIALFALIRVEFDKLGAGITTNPGPGSSTPFFPLTLLSKIVFDRFLVDLCLPRTSSRRWLHRILWISPEQKARWCNSFHSQSDWGGSKLGPASSALKGAHLVLKIYAEFSDQLPFRAPSTLPLSESHFGSRMAGLFSLRLRLFLPSWDPSAVLLESTHFQFKFSISATVLVVIMEFVVKFVVICSTTKVKKNTTKPNAGRLGPLTVMNQ